MRADKGAPNMDIVKPVGYDVTTPDRRDLPAWYLPLIPYTLKPCFVVSKHEDVGSSFYYVTAPDKSLWDPVFSTVTEAVDFLRRYDTDFYLDDSCDIREQEVFLDWSDYGRIQAVRRRTSWFAQHIAYQYVLNPKDYQASRDFVMAHPVLWRLRAPSARINMVPAVLLPTVDPILIQETSDGLYAAGITELAALESAVMLGSGLCASDIPSGVGVTAEDAVTGLAANMAAVFDHEGNLRR